MKGSPKQYAELLYTTLEKDKYSFQDVIDAFVEMLAKEGVLSDFPAIKNAFIDMYNEKQGVVDVKLTTAKRLLESERDIIQKDLSEKMRKNVILDTKVKKSIIGGMRVEFDDMVLDGSIMYNLKRLETTLRKS